MARPRPCPRRSSRTTLWHFGAQIVPGVRGGRHGITTKKSCWSTSSRRLGVVFFVENQTWRTNRIEHGVPTESASSCSVPSSTARRALRVVHTHHRRHGCGRAGSLSTRSAIGIVLRRPRAAHRGCGLLRVRGWLSRASSPESVGFMHTPEPSLTGMPLATPHRRLGA